MKILKPQELKTIEQFFKLSQKQLHKALNQYLKINYSKVITKKEYIIAIGDIPIALVAHLDTVFQHPPKEIYYDREKNVMWSPNGLGADDRAGVYSIIKILKSGLRPTIILTTDEELGGLGAEKIVEDYPEVITKLNYIIQLDRQGSTDCVFYNCNNHKFDEYVENFGFITEFGSFSDISIICPAWKIAGVNLSVGYYNEHSIAETLHIGQMINTIEKVKIMLKEKNIPFFEFIPSVYYYNNFWSNIYKDNYYDDKTSTIVQCAKCKEYNFDYNTVPVKDKNGKILHYCIDCLIDEEFPVCDKCEEFFIPNGSETLCHDCLNKEEKENDLLLEEVPQKKS